MPFHTTLPAKASPARASADCRCDRCSYLIRAGERQYSRPAGLVCTDCAGASSFTRSARSFGQMMADDAAEIALARVAQTQSKEAA